MAYVKPASVNWVQGSGFYGGATIQITRNSSTAPSDTYIYLYVADASSSYTYYRKATNWATSTYSLTLQTDTSFSDNYKWIYVAIANQDYGSSTTFGDSNGVLGCKVPRIACQIYNGSSSKSWYNTRDHDLSIDLLIGDYGYYGATTSSSSTSPTYSLSGSADGDGWYPAMNNQIFYAIHYKAASTSTSTGYYYRGSNSKKSVTITTTTAAKYLYGKGTTSGGSTSTSVGSMTKTCLSDSSYSFYCWTTSPISSSGSGSFYTYAEDAFEESNTIYGIYTKAGGTTTSNAYYYRGTNSQKSVTKTTTTAAAEYYGTGQHTGGGTTVSYGTPTTSHASDTSWVFQGWATSADTYTSYNSNASTAWGSSNTIYAVYKKTETMTYYPQNGASSNSVSTTNYAYGTGSTTANVPTEPTLTYDGYNFLGWATTSTGTGNTWNNQWNSGNRTVYAIWKINTIPIQIHDGEKYINYAIYIHNGTEYVKVIPHVHNGTVWKQLKSQ